MKTFLQYLTERLLKGLKTGHGYAEIFVNPTPNELATIAGRPASDYDLPLDVERNRTKLGGKCYYLGAILTDKLLYVFDRDIVEHAAIYRELDGVTNHNSIPLYLVYFPATNIICIQISSFSVDISMDDGTLAKRAAQSPRFKSFARVIGPNLQDLRPPRK